MVLSNKKIKQRLRAFRAEIVVASEAEKNPGNPKDAYSKASPYLRAILTPVSQKPRLSKRVIRRERALNGDAVENGEVGGDAEAKKKNGSESDVEEVKEKTKRKRDESEALEELEEKKPKVKERKKRWRDRDPSEVSRKMMERKTRQLNRRNNERNKKPKKQAENGEVKEEAVEQSESGATAEQLVAVTNESTERKYVEVSDKIYAGGIPYYSTEDDIRSFFESCGTITEMDCMTFPDTGKFRGIAIITFKTEAAAKRGLALDGCDIFGEDKETGEFKGYGHVDFGDNLSLNKALKLDQRVVCRRPVKISYAVPKKGTVVTSLKTPPKDKQVSAVDETLITAKTEVTDVSLEVNISSEPSANASAKIRRRTCYECGERGHISSLCPKKKADDSTNPDKETEEFKGYGHEDFGDTVSMNTSAKSEQMRINYSMPSKGNVVTNLKTVPKYDQLNAVDTQVNTSSETNDNAVVSSKIRRRTCYECGERGHISSLCPKKKADDSTNSDKETEEFKGHGHVDFGDNASMYMSLKSEPMRISYPLPNKGNTVTNLEMGPKYDQLNAVVDTQGNTSSETNGTAVVSSKIKRRACYECGKRGHISSLCPEKKEDNLANQGGT